MVVRANGREVAVFNDRGTFVGLDNRCLHQGGPIGEGFVKDGTVTCPWHWWRYDVRTGERLGAPFLRLERYRVAVRDGEILVEVPPAEEPASIREVLLRHARQAREERSMRLRGVIFDMGGILYQTPFEVMERVERELGLPTGSLPRGPFGDTRDPDYEAMDAGHLGEPDYVRRLRERLASRGVDLDPYGIIQPKLRLRREVADALLPIRKRYRTAILTNDATAWMGERWWERWDLADRFDAIVDAGAAGLRKPAPQIYRRAAEALGLPMEACLFVDDLRVNVGGAERVGMRGLWFDVTDPGGSVVRVLETLGIDKPEGG